MNASILNVRQERSKWIATLTSPLGEMTVRWVGGDPVPGASADVELDCESCEMLEKLPEASAPALEASDETGSVFVGKVEEYDDGVLAIRLGEDLLHCETDDSEWPAGQWVRFRCSELTAYQVAA